ncbi:hypothetical protein [Sphingobacterium anhuiense]|uniref:hypothetical protein n=1 Tax=Sphingobacterium anhuiense TaxID=493780 RepID=UPI003C2B26D2
MKLFNKVFAKKERKELKQCEDLALGMLEAELLYGGYREPKPPIHSSGPIVSGSSNLTNLFNESKLNDNK